MEEDNKLTIKDKIAIVVSVVALGLSLFSFFRDSVMYQHVLRASVVEIGGRAGRLHATILLVNAGKHYETLYQARFLYSDDLSKGQGSWGTEKLGPLVLKPGEAVVLTLDSRMPDIEKLRKEGIIKTSAKSGIHLGVTFNVVTPSGEMKDDTIIRVTEMFFTGTEWTGSGQRPGDHNTFVDLI